MKIVCDKITLTAEMNGTKHFVIFPASKYSNHEYEQDLDNISTDDFEASIRVLKLQINHFNDAKEK